MSGLTLKSEGLPMPLKGGDFVPIKWSALRVSEAMDMVEEYVNQAVEPLEQVRIVAREARNIPDLPQYVDQHLLRIIGEVDRAIGGSQWEPVGRLKAGIQSVRESLPDEAMKDEKKRAESGSQLSLVA
jgi:hypothetical protein